MLDLLKNSYQGELLITTRGIGHYLILPAMLDKKLAVEVLEKSRVAGGIRNRQM
jgi:hypothetical protein